MMTSSQCNWHQKFFIYSVASRDMTIMQLAELIAWPCIILSTSSVRAAALVAVALATVPASAQGRLWWKRACSATICGS